MNPITRVPRQARELPEYTNYPDRGCKAAVSCLACPLAMCLHDDPAQTLQGRDQIILAEYLGGATVRELSEKWDRSERVIHRALQHAREGHSYWRKPDVGVKISLEELASRSIFRVKEPWPTLEVK